MAEVEQRQCDEKVAARSHSSRQTAATPDARRNMFAPSLDRSTSRNDDGGDHGNSPKPAPPALAAGTVIGSLGKRFVRKKSREEPPQPNAPAWRTSARRWRSTTA